MKPLNRLRLILGILRTQAVYRCAHGGKLSVVVAIGTGLRCTATCPGDGVPRCYPARRLFIRASRSWVAIDDEPRSTFFGQIDLQPGSSPQADRREHRPTKVITRSIVFRDRQVLGKRVKIVSSHRWLTREFSGADEPRVGMTAAAKPLH